MSDVRYSCIVADPPWNVKAGPGGGGYSSREGKMAKWNWRSESLPTRKLSYPSMSVDEICALPVRDIASDNAHLYLWTINAYVEQAYVVARAWGFKPSTMLVWAKRPMGGGLGGAFGISTEYCLFCRRGKLAATGRVKGTWFNWKRPYDERGKPKHSAKPPEFYQMVEGVSPGPRLEMFARTKRDGWSIWGNELPNDVTLPDANQFSLSIAS